MFVFSVNLEVSGGWYLRQGMSQALPGGQETLSPLSRWYVSESLLAHMMGTQMQWAARSP